MFDFVLLTSDLQYEFIYKFLKPKINLSGSPQINK